MDIEKLHKKIEDIVMHNLHWQDLFQTRIGLLNEPMSEEELKKIRDVGYLRYRNDALFLQRVKSLSNDIIKEIKKTVSE